MPVQTLAIPCVLMRAGTSRGPFFLASDLPSDPAKRDEILINAMGAGHQLQIDGIGGGNPLTSKVAIVSRSSQPNADVDYLFAQVKVAERSVDTSPNCGNMLSGVGPFAIERGLVRAQEGVTTVRIFNVNTGKLIEARILTPGGTPTFDGDCVIDGVPEPAAPIELRFLDAAGAKTGHLLPTGRPTDRIGGLDVSCVDCAMPLVIIRACDLGLTARESPEEIDADIPLMQRIEAIRRQAGASMGLGDVSGLVIPKPVLIGPPSAGGTLAARYLMPHAVHRAFAITGAIGLATACVTSGTVAHQLTAGGHEDGLITIEHPSGRLQLTLSTQVRTDIPVASVLRTARRIFDGTLYVRHWT